MSPRDRWESNGPSYWDVVTHADWMKEQYGVGIRWLLVPASRQPAGKGVGSWCVSVEVWALRSKTPRSWHAQESFGHGGSWKTLPAAMLQTLFAVEQKRKDEEAAARSQTVF